MRLLLFIVMMVISLPALAQEQDISFEVDLSSCKADAEKQCTGEQASSMQAIMMCLQANVDAVSTPCQQALAYIGAEMEKSANSLHQAVETCTPDLDKHCMSIKGTKANPVECLKNHQADVSNNCIKALKETGLWETAETTAAN